MNALVLVVLGALAGLCFATHFALFLGVYAPVRRRLRQLEASDAVNPPCLVPFQENNIGIDPEAAYLYAAFSIQPDEVLLIRGRLDPSTPYASMSLYDTYLQGFPGRSGPTHLNHRDLCCDANGAFEIVLSHQDLGWSQWLDIGGHCQGVVAWRQAEGEVVAPRLQKLRLDQARDGRSTGAPQPLRLTGPLSWGWVRAAYVGWMTVRTLMGWDFLYTLATGQDAADFNRFEDLGAALDRDHEGRRRHLEGRPAPHFDMERSYPEHSLGAHVYQHFSGPAQDVQLAPTQFPLSARGMWAKDRWRHMHDLRHVLLGLGTTLPEELVLHGFQLAQHPTWSGGIILCVGFPLAVLHGVSPWRLIGGIVQAYRGGRTARLVVALPVEDWANRPIEEVRKRLGIVPMGQRYGACGPFYMRGAP